MWRPNTHTYWNSYLKLKRELLLARTTPLLRAKLKARNDWTDTILDDINWEAHRRALNRNEKQRTTINKFLHGILPTGKVAHRNDPKYPEHCFSCPEPVETFVHLLIHCPFQQPWRTQVLQDLKKELTTLKTHLDVMELIVAGVHALLHGQPTQSITIPPNLIHIAHAQQEIGWIHMLRGRLSKQWTLHHDAQLGTNATPKSNGTTWTTDLADFFLKKFLELWSIRNKERHGYDKTTRAQAAQRHAIYEMTQLYAYKDSLPIERQWILATPLEERLHWTGPYMRAWINTYKPLITESPPNEMVGD